MLEGKPLDILVHDDIAASSAIAILCERIQSENDQMIKDIDQLIQVRFCYFIFAERLGNFVERLRLTCTISIQMVFYRKSKERRIAEFLWENFRSVVRQPLL